MDVDDELNITPSFKSKSRKDKGKGKVIQLESATASPAQSDLEDNDNNEAANSSAVMFKKKSAKSRGAGGIGASSSSAKKGNESTSSRSKLALSFGADDDNEGGLRDTATNDADGSFQESAVRRQDSSSSRKLKRPPVMPPSSNANYDAASSLSSTLSQTSITAAPASRPTYSKDYLEELKASTAATPAAMKQASTNGSTSNGYDSLTISKFGNSMLAEDDGPAELPTEGAIATAKARRETARRLGIDTVSDSRSSDYISLDVGMPVKNRESRLVREEDEIGEGDDDHADFTGASERILLGKKGRQKMEKDRKEGMRDLIDAAMDEEDEGLMGDGVKQEEDEESRRWELEQIRRGEQRRPGEADDVEQVPYTPASIPEATAIPSLASTTNRLAAALAEFQSSKGENDILLANSARESEALAAQEAELRLEVTRINTKLEWFTDFKAWIEDVATFLDEKVPALEKIENDYSSVLMERREMLLRRRYQDDSDDVALFTGANIPVKYITEEEPSKADDQAMEVDELGRSRSDTDLEPRSFPRKNRRLDRQKRHTLRTRSDGAQHSATDEGDLTDDELVASDSQDLRAASESLVQAVEALFADVESEEYKDPSLGIRPRFEDWKHRYGEEYGHAFAGLAMVGVWEFWARTELAAWNPFGIPELQQANTSLESFSWHKALSDFQHARATSVEASGGAEQPDSADDVVHGMVATVVVPRLRRLVLEGFDPYSSSGTAKALATVEEITYCLETNHVRFESLIMAFLSCYQVAILRLQSLIVPFTSEVRAPVSGINPDAIQARQRIARRCYKLLSNAMRWRRYAKAFILPAGGEGYGLGAGGSWDACLARELVEKVLLPVLEAGWETGGSAIASQVLKLFPGFSMPDDIARRLKA